MVKLGGIKKRKLRKKHELNKIEEKFINFVEIRGYSICIIGLGGMDEPLTLTFIIELLPTKLK